MSGQQKGAVAAAARRRRRLLLAGGAALGATGLALALVLAGGADGEDAAAAAGSPAPTSAPAPAPTAPAPPSVVPLPPTPTPTGPTEDVDEPPPALPEVPIDQPAAVGNGVVATVAGIEGIDGTAVGPGNIAGPALRVTVRIENGTTEALSLDGVAVNLFHGADRTPASPLEDPSRAPFVGLVEPGGTGEGVYVFSVPTDVRDLVTVEVGYQAGAPLLLFTGPAA